MHRVHQLVELLHQARYADAREAWLALGDDRLTRPALLEAGASIHEQLGQHAMAAALWRRLLAHHPDAVSTWTALAEASHRAGDRRGAVAAWQRVRELAPDDLKPLVRLALLHEELRDRVAARAAATEAAQRAPGQYAAQRVLIRLDHQEGNLDEAHRRATSLLSQELTDEVRAGLLLELAVVERRRKRYDEAFEAATHGNRLALGLNEAAGWSLDAYPDLLERISRWRGRVAPPREPDARPAPVFMVGFPRSGTTLVQQILQAHPAVQTLDEEDPAMEVLRAHHRGEATLRYPQCLEGLDEAAWSQLREDYWRVVDSHGLDEHRVLVDKLPLNLVRLDYLVRLFPDCRVLVILRDPRDSVLSNYFQDYEPNTAMVQCTDLERTARLYARVMDLWLHRRTTLRVPWREQRYEDVAGDTEAQARAMLEFIGVDWDPAVLAHHRAAGARVISTPSRYDVSKPVYRTAVGRWRHFERHLAPVLPILAPYAIAFGYD